MKKLFALLLALMMLALPFASAEQAFTFSDPVIVVNMGEEMTIDLTGLQLLIAAGQVGEIPAVQIDINGDGQKLYGISMNITQTEALVALDGVSQVLKVAIPEAATSAANLDLSGLDIDMDALMETLMNGIQVEDDTITVPYTTVNELLAQVLLAFEGMEIPGVDTTQLTEAAEELLASNSGVTLVGSYTQDEDGSMAVAGEAYLVQDGEVQEESLCSLGLAIVGEAVTISLDVKDMGSFGLVIDGEQITISADVMGTSFSLTGKVGSTEADVEFVELDGTDAIDANAMTEEQSEQLSNELMAGASDLINYVYSALGAAEPAA